MAEFHFLSCKFHSHLCFLIKKKMHKKIKTMSRFFVVEPDGKTGMTPLKPDMQSGQKILNN